MREICYRTSTEADFPILAEKFASLNSTYYQLGYLLPHPGNVGEAWIDSFRRTLGRFSNLFIAESFDPTTPDNQAVLCGFTLCRVKRVPAHMGGLMVGELSDIWVDPESRRLGIAAHLTDMVLDWMHKMGVHSVEVQVLKDNEPAWKLFQQLGFQYEFRSARFLMDRPDLHLFTQASKPVNGAYGSAGATGSTGATGSAGHTEDEVPSQK
jgi:ribosomal protein S18 acetylase RimI-like enzyme